MTPAALAARTTTRRKCLQLVLSGPGIIDLGGDTKFYNFATDREQSGSRLRRPQRVLLSCGSSVLRRVRFLWILLELPRSTSDTDKIALKWIMQLVGENGRVVERTSYVNAQHPAYTMFPIMDVDGRRYHRLRCRTWMSWPRLLEDRRKSGDRTVDEAHRDRRTDRVRQH